MSAISDRKRSEEKIRMLSLSIEQSVASIMITSLDGKIEHVNSNFTNLTGYSKEEIIGKNPRILKSGQQSTDVYVELWNTITSGNVWEGLFCNRKKNGELYWETQSIYPVKNGNGTINHFISINIDETERIRSGKELLKSQKRMVEAQRILHFGDWEWDIVNNKLYWSDEMYKIFGLPLHKFKLTFESFLEIVHPDDRELVKISIDNALYKNIPYNVDHKVVLPEGTVRFVHEQSEVTFNDNGKPIQMSGTTYEITKRIRQEEEVLKHNHSESFKVLDGYAVPDVKNVLPSSLVNAELETTKSNCTEIINILKRSDEYLKILFDYAPDAYYLSDLKGIFIDGNRMAETITGYKLTDLIGKNFLKLKIISIKQLPKIIKLLFKNARGLSTGPDDIIFYKKDGTEAIFEIRTYPVRIAKKMLVLGIARDITKRKQLENELEKYHENLEKLVRERTLKLEISNKALKKEVDNRILIENALRTSEKKYRLLMEQASDGICIADKNGKYLDVNLKACEILGYEYRELIGLNMKKLMFF